MAAAITKEGWLHVLSRKASSRRGTLRRRKEGDWTRLWAVANSQVEELRCYDGPKSLETRLAIKLDKDMRIEEGDAHASGREHVFSVGDTSVSAESAEEVVEWIKVLRACVTRRRKSRRGFSVTRSSVARLTSLNADRDSSSGRQLAGKHTWSRASTPKEPERQSRSSAASLRSGSRSTIRGGRLVTVFRELKRRVELQPHPRVIEMPNDTAYRSFPLGVCVGKLCRAYASLDTLSFEGARFADLFFDEVAAELAEHSQITGCRFANETGASYTEDKLGDIAYPASVVNLSFERGILGSAGLQRVVTSVISRKRSLRSLSLRESHLDAGSMTSVCIIVQQSRLFHLDLSHCELGDTLVKALLGALSDASITLATLDLSGNRIGKGCASSLRLFLQNNNSVSELTLSHNASLGKGAADAIFETLSLGDSSVQNVRCLRLAHVGGLSSQAVTALCSMLSANQVLRTLDISGNRLKASAGDSVRRALLGNTSLYTLSYAEEDAASDFDEVTRSAIGDILLRNCIARDASGETDTAARESTPRTVDDYDASVEEGLVRLLDMLDVERAVLVEAHEKSSALREIQQAVQRAMEGRPRRVQLELEGIFAGRADHMAEAMLQLVETTGALVRDAAEARASRMQGLSERRMGPLWKRGGQMMSWKKRHFALAGSFVTYSASQNAAKPLGMILLDGARIEAANDGPTGCHAFHVETSHRTYHLAADTAADREQWMAAMQRVVDLRSVASATRPLDTVGSGLERFSAFWDAESASWPCVRTRWVLQWWLPQILELTVFGYDEALSVESHTLALQERVVHHTASALWLLSGAAYGSQRLERELQALRGVQGLDKRIRRAVMLLEMQANGEEAPVRHSVRRGALERDHRALPDLQQPLSPALALMESSPEVGDVACALLAHASESVLSDVLLLHRHTTSVNLETRVASYRYLDATDMDSSKLAWTSRQHVLTARERPEVRRGGDAAVKEALENATISLDDPDVDVCLAVIESRDSVVYYEQHNLYRLVRQVQFVRQQAGRVLDGDEPEYGAAQLAFLYHLASRCSNCELVARTALLFLAAGDKAGALGATFCSKTVEFIQRQLSPT